MEIDERPEGFGSYEVRFPAETPLSNRDGEAGIKNYAKGYQRHL